MTRRYAGIRAGTEIANRMTASKAIYTTITAHLGNKGSKWFSPWFFKPSLWPRR